MAWVALDRQVTWPQLDAGELRTVDKSCVQEVEFVGAICLYHMKYLRRHQGVPNTEIQDGQRPPGRRHLVGKTWK